MGIKGKRIALQRFNNPEQVKLSTAFEDFLQSCKLKNLAPATIKSYKNHWKKFEYWADYLYVNDISQQLINDYILYLNDYTDVTESINSNLRHIRAILNYFSDKYNTFINYY